MASGTGSVGQRSASCNQTGQFPTGSIDFFSPCVIVNQPSRPERLGRGTRWPGSTGGPEGGKKVISRILVAAGLTAAGLSHALAELPETSFGDWTLRCNSKTYCIAETEGTGPDGEAFRLKIERSAKPGSDVFVTFRPETELKTGMRARIEIEGEEDNYGFFGTAGKIYTGNEMTFGGEADRDLIENLRLGSEATVQIEFGGPAGTRSYSLSLEGITQALLRMDGEQARIGRLDAIVAWGGIAADARTGTAVAAKSPPAVEAAAPQPAPPAPQDNLPPPIMPSQETNNSGIDRGSMGQVYELAELPDEVHMMGVRTLGCQLDETVPAFGAQYHAQGDVEVWIVPCTMADVNVPYYLAVHIPFDPSLDEWKEFETPPGFNQPNHALVNNLFYDPASGNVTGTTYYGPGYDCGSFERHEEDPDSGEYTLIEYLEKASCDGVAGPPEGWALSWTIDEMGD